MKRYLAFFGRDYYPCGGMDDFVNDFDTIEEGIDAIEKIVEQSKVPDWSTPEEEIAYIWEFSWAHIYDTETRKEVWSK